ncbi:tetratricopeptide repeat protein [Streptomyces sp. NPDC047123]|uniref:tetratricopeptide repeat protein n=1 Tax=Streptomyces sp. NPDC047123 TaxID=3155622 RepID=UPI0033C76B93
MAKWRWGRRYDLGKRTLAGGTVADGSAARHVSDRHVPDQQVSDGQVSDQQVSGSGNATASNGGIAVSGIYNDHSSVVLPPEAVRPVSDVRARPGLDNLPYRTAQFVGRAAALDALDAAMKRRRGGCVQAVHGLGGVGKSTLAVHWAATRARKHGLTPVRWMAADSASAVEQGLASLAASLQPASSKALTVEALAENGMQWLAAHSGWLLILDNVNHLADIAPVLARAPRGHFLITSRLATVWHDATAVIRLDALQPAESLALLTHIAGSGGSRDLTGADELCTELGHLPLAVEQAAAFLAQNPLLTPRSYLDLLARDPAPLYERGGDGYTIAERTIARVWRVTLDRVGELQPLAPDMLRTLAWYAPDGIPVDLVDGEGGPASVAGAIGILNAYSMITVDPAARTFCVHRLLQAVARTADTADPHRSAGLVAEARDRATTALEAAVRPTDWQDPASWPFGRTVLPHMEAIADHAPPSADTTTTARLLNHAGVFCLSQGLASRSSVHLERALDHHQRELGPDDVNTLACRHSLAGAHEAAGHVKRAIPLYESVLRDEEHVLGATHPLTLASRNNLADAYRAAGHPEQALALLAGGPGADPGPPMPPGTPMPSDTRRYPGMSVPASTSVEGEDLFSLSARNTLARSRQESGDHAGAMLLYEKNLAACVRVLGGEHHLTLTARNNLAAARRAELLDRQRKRAPERPGHPENTEGSVPGVSHVETILRDMERVLGDEHPDTLVARGNLAAACKDAGDLDRAVSLYEETVPAMERVLGEDHGITRAARVSLALAHLAAEDFDQIDRLATPSGAQSLDTRSADIGYGLLAHGDGARAVPLFEQAVQAAEGRLAADDPNSLTTKHNLAVAHLMAGAPEQALPLFEEVLRLREDALGAEHPDTLTSRRHLADAHREAGDFDRAASLYEQTYRARERELGPDHPDTLAALGLLAYARQHAGGTVLSLPLYERALQGMEQVLGPFDIGTLTARNGLAGAHQKAGDLPRAVLLYEHNLDACAEALGRDHAHTLTTCHNLAVALATAGDLRRALPLLWDTLRRQKRELGGDHLDTLTTQLNLAGFYRAAGAPRKARRLYKRTLATCVQALGEGHPLTRSVHQQMAAAGLLGT